MSGGSYWDDEREATYREGWDRAMNGSRSRAARTTADAQPIPQAYPVPEAYRAPSSYAPVGYQQAGYQQAGYQPVGYQPQGYQRAGYQPIGQQPAGYRPMGYQQAGYQKVAYGQMPQLQTEPELEPAPRGRRRATGFYIFLSWTALFAWMAFIYFMSSHTSSELAQGIFAHIRAIIEEFVWTYYGYVEDPVSPICHFGEYFILGALLGNALHCHMPFIPATLLAIAAASGYGYTDEIHQLSVAGRMFDLEDWKIDTIAAAFGSFLMLFFFLLGSRRERT